MAGVAVECYGQVMKDIAVIGAGYWGQNLVRNVSDLGRLAVVCDVSERTRDRIAMAFPSVRVTDDLDTILSDSRIRGVMIAVPSRVHAQVAHRCLSAGKHVYVEKPITLDVAEAEELCNLAEEAGLKLMVGHLLLFHPCVRWIKKSIEDGVLGDVLYLNSVRVNLSLIHI